MKKLALMILIVMVSFHSPSTFAASAGESQVIEVCFSPKENCDEKLIEFISSSQKSLDIAIYSVTLPSIVDAIDQAYTRGVKVRMVVDRTQAAGNKSLVQELINRNIPLKIGRGSGVMHNKFTIVDREVIQTGSYNYTSNATENNAENQIYLQDPKVISSYEAHFEELWAKGKPTTGGN